MEELWDRRPIEDSEPCHEKRKKGGLTQNAITARKSLVSGSVGKQEKKGHFTTSKKGRCDCL